MKVNELMVGDLFDVHRSECVADGGHFQEWQEYGKIVGITEDYVTVKYIDREEDYGVEDVDHSDLKPIPLTEEILKENGFMCVEKCSKPKLAKYVCRNISVIFADNNYLYISPCLTIKCDYIHELQHALRLCGIDKNIEL